jgi:hypothetical protein
MSHSPEQLGQGQCARGTVFWSADREMDEFRVTKVSSHEHCGSLLVTRRYQIVFWQGDEWTDSQITFAPKVSSDDGRRKQYELSLNDHGCVHLDQITEYQAHNLIEQAYSLLCSLAGSSGPSNEEVDTGAASKIESSEENFSCEGSQADGSMNYSELHDNFGKILKDAIKSKSLRDKLDAEAYRRISQRLAESMSGQMEVPELKTVTANDLLELMKRVFSSHGLRIVKLGEGIALRAIAIDEDEASNDRKRRLAVRFAREIIVASVCPPEAGVADPPQTVDDLLQ